MDKELKIVAPEGYEIDKTNSTLERIVFKKKSDGGPKSWEEFCHKYEWTGEEYYISSTGYEKTKRRQYDLRFPINRGYTNNKEEAEAFLALMQLRQLRKAWVGDWEPDWCDDSTKYEVGTRWGGVCVMYAIHGSMSITFPTQAMAEEFMECFKTLLEQAKSLI